MSCLPFPRSTHRLLALILFCGLVAAAVAADDQPITNPPPMPEEPLSLAASSLAGQGAPQVRPLERPDVLPRMKTLMQSKACQLGTIHCGDTISDEIDSLDCGLLTGVWVDFWQFSGQSGDTVTINASSIGFDNFLALLDPEPEAVTSDEPGRNTRVVYTLDQSGTWTIGISNWRAFRAGDYVLSLECEGGSTPTPPAAPSNLTATTVSSTEVQLGWQDNSDNEDEFRIESRFSGGSYQDIGSVPADSTGATVFALNPATTYDFRVRARNGAGNSGYSTSATATTLDGSGDCQPSDTVLCLQDGRFRVESGREAQAGYQPGIIVLKDDGSAVMRYVSASKWELILNIQPRGSFYWFSAAGLTEGREYDISVTDLTTDETWTFKLPESNPRVTNAPLSERE